MYRDIVSGALLMICSVFILADNGFAIRNLLRSCTTEMREKYNSDSYKQMEMCNNSMELPTNFSDIIRQLCNFNEEEKRPPKSKLGCWTPPTVGKA